MDNNLGGLALPLADDVVADAASVAPDYTAPTDDAAEPQGLLTAQTLKTLHEFFDAADHHPSTEHWRALGDIATTMERMAEGRCAPSVYLSSIDCGVGKTQTVIHFARALAESPKHRNVGMIVCVGRIKEATDLAADLGDLPGGVAVLTSDKKANRMGLPDGVEPPNPSDARVLITTQQRIEHASRDHGRSNGRTFDDVASLYFRGAARQVRVWDEAWLPGVVVTLERTALLYLVRPIGLRSQECANALEDFAGTLRHREDGDLVDVPDFEAVPGVSLHEVIASLAEDGAKLRDDQRMVATALLTLNGKTARVRRNGKTGNTVLTYENTLPGDMAPLLVLDASGRVRETYPDVEKHRGTLVRLRPAVKDYSPLTVHIWRTSGSKSGFHNNGDALVEGIVKTILKHPDDEWLVVAHKPGARLKNVREAIQRALPAEVSNRVTTITWGAHMATNAFRDVSRVILAGTLFMPDSFYTALTHLSQDRSVVPGLLPMTDVAKTMRGEHANVTLQAVCRGQVRKCDGARCGSMNAYIIASPKSGIPRDLQRIFPGCVERSWNPLTRELTGKGKKALEFVKAALQDGQRWIETRAIAKHVSIDHRNYPKQIGKVPEWKSAVRALGLTVCRGPRGRVGLRLTGSVASQA